ncbi:MAG: hypothetical protein IJX33_06195 [Akkermansia sp.]|nr:hypothetical protein [Akkermansia sp.]
MNAVSPCVLPRRRFVLWFLGGCVLWVVACGVYRGMLSRELLPTPEFVTLFLLEVVMLSIPSRTSHGTLMQLIGLAMPLSAAVLLPLVVALAGEGTLDGIHHDSARRGNDSRIIPLPSGVLVDMPDA